LTFRLWVDGPKVETGVLDEIQDLCPSPLRENAPRDQIACPVRAVRSESHQAEWGGFTPHPLDDKTY